jgi:alpha-amylase
VNRPRLTLALAFHNHQPVGNFPVVFEQAYRQAYEPMVAALERHPAVRVALHYSGPVLDWLREAQPDLLTRVRALVARGQVEIMTGGYYEPILPAIPDRDKRGQILKMTQAVRDLFGYDATGLWLAERVWEPHLPKVLAAAGVSYTIVDDTHFLHVGLTDAELVGHFVTEEDGALLAILPSAKALRYRIPWAAVPDLMQWLHAQAADDDRVLVMGDDGEKFGLWPGTHRLCWERGWIESFFSALEGARDWLTVVPPGEWVNSRAPRGRIYLPTASYDEMTEWALPASAAARLPALKHELEAQGRHDVLAFVRGGFWRHFLVKYPEINTLHKTMLRVSRRVWAMRPGPRRDEALDHLWQAQCNCPYWHGVFGGIYLGHIRSANYAHLIAAERLADAGRGARRWVEAHTEDLDADGQPEVLVRSDAQVLSIDPADGGSVVTWDVREAGVNLVNVMTRYAEGYHETLRQAIARGEAVLYRPDETESIHTTRVRVKEWGLERYLVVDWYRRSSLLDHFLAPGGTPEAFARGGVRELGDFVNQPYVAVLGSSEGVSGPGTVVAAPERAGPGRRRRGTGSATVRLVRDGHVWIGNLHASVRVEKTLMVPAGRSGMEVSYRISNRSDAMLVADFAVETNWGTMGPDARVVVGANTFRVGEARHFPDATAFTLRDDGWHLTVAASIESPQAPKVWMVPIEVVSASEAGFERTFQGASTLVVWPLRLAPGAMWEARISFAIEPLAVRVA